MELIWASNEWGPHKWLQTQTLYYSLYYAQSTQPDARTNEQGIHIDFCCVAKRLPTIWYEPNWSSKQPVSYTKKALSLKEISHLVSRKIVIYRLGIY